MKIDWGRVPEGTLVRYTYSNGSSAIEFFGKYDKGDNKIISFEFDDFSDHDAIWVNADYFSLVMPDDIEKYTIKEEPRYVCPVCGEEVEQDANFTIYNRHPDGVWNYDKLAFCKKEGCGVTMLKINGHFGKKVGG